MKLFSKIAVVAAAFMLVSVFAGCKTEEEPGVLAEYIDVDTSVNRKITFFDNNTLELYGEGMNPDTGKFCEMVASGSYEGDVSKDGTITYEITSLEVDGEDAMVMFTMEGASTKGKLVITNETKTINCSDSGPFYGEYKLKK